MVKSSAHLLNQRSRREPATLVLAKHELEDVVAESRALVGKGSESVVAQKTISSSPDEGCEQTLKLCLAVNPIVCLPDGLEEVVHVSIWTSADLVDDSVPARLGDIVATDLNQLLVTVLSQEGQCVIGESLQVECLAEVVDFGVGEEVAFLDAVLVLVECYYACFVSPLPGRNDW